MENTPMPNGSQESSSAHNCQSHCGRRGHHWLAKFIIVVLIFAAGYCFGVFKTVLKYRIFGGYGNQRYFNMKMMPYGQQYQSNYGQPINY